MANVWVSDKCPKCRKPVVGEGILVAKVAVTSEDTYACYKTRKRDVRPLFRSKQRSLYHLECFEQKEA